MKNITFLQKSLLLAFTSVAMLSSTNSDAQIYASSADLYRGTFANSNPIPESYFRSQKFNAIGEPQRSDVSSQVNGNPNSVNFCSLGFGGSIVLTMQTPFGQCEGPDGFAHETSYNTPSCGSWREFAKLEVSQDGCNWYTVVESACQDFAFDLPDEMPWAKYIRITDVSNPNHFGGGADGWDLDGVEAFCSSNINQIPEGVPFGANTASLIQGTLKNGGAIAASRSIASRALGLPENNSTINFVALGFDNPNTEAVEGVLVLGFDYTVFDQPGTHDIEVFETTFGDSPGRPCSTYPEIAKFEGSVDGINWYLLTAVDEPGSLPEGRLCRDGKLDIGNMPNGVLRYLRITDESERNSTRFPGNADAYDVDGVVVHPCPSNSSKIVLTDRNDIPDEDNYFNFSIFPNPAQDVFTLIFGEIVETNVQITISDVSGRSVISERVLGANSHSMHQININELPTGVYMIIVEGNNIKSSQKLIKK
ncbi:MAG: T9SS type A sorting domain-containing protein [Flavobacteriales bacterium]